MSATATTPLAVERDGAVMTLTLNRPEVLNSLSLALVEAIAAAVAQARADDTVRVLVITGAGRGFCAGADLAERMGGERVDVRRTLAERYGPIIRGLREMEKPVLAAVNGVAAGAGMSLALAADLRIAAESASFIQAFVRIGLVPDAGSSFFLPRLVGTARALELAMLGDRVSAAEAERIGLVNRVVPDAELAAATAELAGRLARGPRSVGLVKRLMNQSLGSDLGMQLGHEEDLQALAMASDDFREGVTAFLEKRPAEFRGR